jgi:hypothetical protein
MRCLFPFLAVLLLGLPACSATPSSGSKQQQGPPPPCHPGCFPAGTTIATPDGLRPIESIGVGDVVTLIGADGTPTRRIVSSTFHTCNLLVEVQTDAGRLLTTRTQPLCLADGEFRTAGDLAEGDVIWRWVDGERRPARVRSVLPKEGEVEVYNLVVGESAVFVAGGFLARGKPVETAP